MSLSVLLGILLNQEHRNTEHLRKTGGTPEH